MTTLSAHTPLPERFDQARDFSADPANDLKRLKDAIQTLQTTPVKDDLEKGSYKHPWTTGSPPFFPNSRERLNQRFATQREALNALSDLSVAHSRSTLPKYLFKQVSKAAEDLSDQLDRQTAEAKRVVQDITQENARGGNTLTTRWLPGIQIERAATQHTLQARGLKDMLTSQAPVKVAEQYGLLMKSMHQLDALPTLKPYDDAWTQALPALTDMQSSQSKAVEHYGKALQALKQQPIPVHVQKNVLALGHQLDDRLHDTLDTARLVNIAHPKLVHIPSATKETQELSQTMQQNLSDPALDRTVRIEAEIESLDHDLKGFFKLTQGDFQAQTQGMGRKEQPMEIPSIPIPTLPIFRTPPIPIGAALPGKTKVEVQTSKEEQALSTLERLVDLVKQDSAGTTAKAQTRALAKQLNTHILQESPLASRFQQPNTLYGHSIAQDFYSRLDEVQRLRRALS